MEGAGNKITEMFTWRIQMAVSLSFLLVKPRFICAIKKESEQWEISCDAKILEEHPLFPSTSFTVVRGQDRLNGWNLKGRALLSDHSIFPTQASESETSGTPESFPPRPGCIRLDYVEPELRDSTDSEESYAGYWIDSYLSSETLHYLLKLNWETHDVHLLALAIKNSKEGEGLVWAGANYEWRHDGQKPMVRLSDLHLQITPRQKG
jgi:hypothetical protein